MTSADYDPIACHDPEGAGGKPVSVTLLSLLARAAIVGSAVCVGALLGNMILRKAAPALRHFLLLAALGSFLAAPLLSLVLPAVVVATPIPISLPAGACSGADRTAPSSFGPPMVEETPGRIP